MCSAGLHMLQILGEYVQCWATHATDIRGSMCSAGLHMLQILGEYVQCWATHATDIRY